MRSAGGPHPLVPETPFLVRPYLLLIALSLLVVAGIATVAAVDIDEDLSVAGSVTWSDDDYTVHANVTVVDGGRLSIKNATVTFVSPEGAPVGLMVEEGGDLAIEGSVCQAQEHPYFVSSSGNLFVGTSELTGLYSAIPLDVISYEDLVGGLQVNGGTLELVDVVLGTDFLALTALGAEVDVDGLQFADLEFGMILANATGTLADVDLTNVTMAMVMDGCELVLTDIALDRVTWAIMAERSDLAIRRMDSFSYMSHIVHENGTTVVEDSTFSWGQEGVTAFLGSLDVRNCTFSSGTTAIEMLYADGRVRDVLVEDAGDIAIMLSNVGYGVEDYVFELDNVTVRNGSEQAFDIEECTDINLSNVTIEGCGDGLQIRSSEVGLTDIIITGVTQCRPVGCSYEATGTGILLESSEVELHNVSILDSNGPGISAYFSICNATSSRIVGGNASGILMLYGLLNLEDCQVADNAYWGIESLGFPIDPDALTGTWGNAIADIRMNLTINAEVVDQNGDWLSHATVTATSGDEVVGPYVTGFGGSTQTFELPVFEYTYGGDNISFNPWTFRVDYAGFNNSTDVELVLGLGEITLHIAILRADLVLEEVRVAADLDLMVESPIRATVANRGNHTVETAMLTFYYINDAGFQRVIGEVAVGPLAPGETVQGTTRWTPPLTGEFTIAAFVDVDDLVDEEVEDNNRLTRETTVWEEGGDGTPGPGAILAIGAMAAASMAVARERGRRDRSSPRRL